jgi:hypothetical protein
VSPLQRFSAWQLIRAGRRRLDARDFAMHGRREVERRDAKWKVEKWKSREVKSRKGKVEN